MSSTVGDLSEAVAQHLENRPAYPQDERCANGLTPAMTLLCLLDHTLLTERVTTALPPGTLTLDLRQVAPRSHAVMRVLLGQAVSDIPTRTASHFDILRWTTRERLSRVYPDWLRATGVPRACFLLGRHLLACWPRPVMECTITLVTSAVPPAADPDALTTPITLDATYDDRLVDMAASLLLLKQGAGEAERGVTQLGRFIQSEPLTKAQQALRAMQRDAPLSAQAVPA